MRSPSTGQCWKAPTTKWTGKFPRQLIPWRRSSSSRKLLKFNLKTSSTHKLTNWWTDKPLSVELTSRCQLTDEPLSVQLTNWRQFVSWTDNGSSVNWQRLVSSTDNGLSVHQFVSLWVELVFKLNFSNFLDEDDLLHGINCRGNLPVHFVVGAFQHWPVLGDLILHTELISTPKP